MKILILCIIIIILVYVCYRLWRASHANTKKPATKENKMPTKILYHYCTTQTFFNILTNKNIRLSNVFDTNDYLERKLIDAPVEKCLDEYGEEYKDFKRDLRFRYYYERDVDAFSLSFSEEQNLLSQWCRYADDATGFAIGFDIEHFNIPNKIPFRSGDWNDTLGMFEMLYDEQAIETRTESIIRDKICLKADLNYGEKLANCVDSLVTLAAMAKGKAFEEEKEWRVFYTPPLVNNGVKGISVAGHFQDLKFALRKNNLISSYFELSFDKEKDPGSLKRKKEIEPIAEIILGPKNKLRIETLRDFLQTHGFGSVNILSSKISYR
jgi:Protein of unknown function (DUF2971)